MTPLKTFIATAGAVGLLGLTTADEASAQAETVRVGWCTSVFTTGAAPFAIAQHFGWYEDLGIEVDLVNFGGSSDCVRNIATGEVLAAVPSLEPMALLQASGVDTKVFYKAFRRNIFGIAVPEDSEIMTYADLKGKNIGVTSMASNGVLIARSVVSSAGLNPDTDVRIVVSGQPAQSAVLMEKGDVQAVSQWDTNYTLMSLAGMPMRTLEDDLISTFPANSFAALPSTIEEQGELLAKVAAGYAMGQMFIIEDPRTGMDIFQTVYPEVTPTGMDYEASLDQGEALLKTVSENWTLDGETENWGESILPTYQKYLDWLVDVDVLPASMEASDIATNELIDEINATIDMSKVEAALAE
ncbi:ABC transporter substrate-binding protein [Citreimonas sp.]|uniref:ABC transporter substrate-binding protein n=1 Tax=Citreimonas sp. TaxID=3036715 RepID=UPI004057DE6A